MQTEFIDSRKIIISLEFIYGVTNLMETLKSCGEKISL